MLGREIVKRAINARTYEEACSVQAMIEQAIGARHERPICGTWNNEGIIKRGGSPDIKLVENVTNMQDSLVYRQALQRFGSPDRVPYQNPREAVESLFSSTSLDSVADRLLVEFYESKPPINQTKVLTAVFRDFGAGISPDNLAGTIFSQGATSKAQLNWQQGSFGLGARTTFSFAKAIIVVSRVVPELLTFGQEDMISVAVLEWKAINKICGLYYLVTTDWESGDGFPFTVPASIVPEFDAGLHLALIDYSTEGYHRKRLGDEKTFDTVLDTRLFSCLLPIRYTNHYIKARVGEGQGRGAILRGLGRRLSSRSREDIDEGSGQVAIKLAGVTYNLPITAYVFAGAPRQPGGKDSFVAHNHSLIYLSNGQAHRAWTPQEFNTRTGYRKLSDRILVVVETDMVPLEHRNRFFTADRSDFTLTEVAIRLENAVASYLKEWDWLSDKNGELVREAINRSTGSRANLSIARKIARMLKFRISGYSDKGRGQAGSGSSGNPQNRPRKKEPKPLVLLQDPTELLGPHHITAAWDTTKCVSVRVNAVDGFIPLRGNLAIRVGHPEISSSDVAVGSLKGGRVTVSIAVADEIETGVFPVTFEIKDWLRSAGGFGPPLCWEAELEVVEEVTRHPKGSNGNGKSGGVDAGSFVAVIWRSLEDEEDWDHSTVGEVEESYRASDLAQLEEYRELAQLGDAKIPTILLNEEYVQFRKYRESRVSTLSPSGIEGIKERYAVGVGVGLMMLHYESKEEQFGDSPLSHRVFRNAQRAVADSVLNMLPEYDRLLDEAGID